MTTFVTYKTTLDNCYVEVPESNARAPHDTVFDVGPSIAVLVEALRHKRPTWTFVHKTNYLPASNIMRVGSFTVRERKETLGSIGATPWENPKAPHRFMFNNDRLEEKRTRGYENRTTNLAKAVKEITGTFYARTQSEVVTAEAKTATSTGSNIVSAASRGFIYSFDHMLATVRDHIMENWDAVVRVCPQLGQHANAEKIQEQYVQYKVGEGLKAAANDQDRHALIVVHNDTYVYTNKTDTTGAWLTYTDDTLPKELSRGVGALKLVNVGTVIQGIGVRTSENAYVIELEIGA